MSEQHPAPPSHREALGGPDGARRKRPATPAQPGGGGAARGRYVAYALIAALLYTLSTPVSKLLLDDVAPGVLAALLYLGAGAGMSLIALLRNRIGTTAPRAAPLERADLPFVVAMVVLDIAAPLLLMFGLDRAEAANVSLLNNFEIVATAVIAFVLFKERPSRRLTLGIVVITAACALLTVDDAGALSFSVGSLLVLAAASCWGLENNCTNRIAHKDPVQIVIVKGFGSGCGAMAVALAAGERMPQAGPLGGCLLLGFLAYGLSITLYVMAQRGLGAARTSAFYSVAPFVGVILAWALFRQAPGLTFLLALGLMLVGTWLVVPEPDD
ncbi:DMT family transporter [Actinomyces ruminicola]|uniref:Permease of the drug/metabolite transporter (DMT) superfamily n=1 Tax=Actinomyces ruminicola TaxID=332524 RepID=A0A1G9SX83_9ACTO|nr:DMT family transporter [Actinomyces ruminicola]SDM39465.1 Permease of the drug/metabolite transporter (DMT) superfamily [Actinomyces ruminicola]